MPAQDLSAPQTTPPLDASSISAPTLTETPHPSASITTQTSSAFGASLPIEAAAPTDVRIAVLVCDGLTEWHKARMGDQMDWFPRLLLAANKRHLAHLNLRLSFDRFDAFLGQLPSADQLSNYSAILISGSKANAFDLDPWIVALKQFIRDHIDAIRFVGVCFGHQVIAEAFGGKVGRMEDGWEVGWTQVEAVGEGKEILLAAYTTSKHLKDHVKITPPNFCIILSNSRAPNQGQVLDDRCLSVQGHPEMIAQDISAILEYRTYVTTPAVFSATWTKNIQAQLTKQVDDVFIGAKLLGFVVGGRKGMCDVH
ncbi:hypothetical protein HDU93_004618 [Gonapodya sp. JEL0774]|nr:hypothetical protein HDU93_004618 [Gonapodya sp. JEL0774]